MLWATGSLESSLHLGRLSINTAASTADSPGLTRVLTSAITSHEVFMVAAFAWPVQDAKARFSEFLEASLANGPQIVTKRGVETAVLVPIEQWRRLQAQTRRDIKELLLAPEARVELPELRRRSYRRRPPIEFAD